MTSPAPITLAEAARLAETALALADKHPGRAVVLTPHVVRLLLDTVAGAAADRARLDWLADRDNHTAQVLLPDACVLNNLHDMRAAIDEAMRLGGEAGEGRPGTQAQARREAASA